MKNLFLILILFLSVNCNSVTEDETQIMNTVCIDGVKNMSIISGLDCMYIPMMDDNYEMVRCGK